MTTTTTAPAYRHPEGADIDTLEALPATTILGENLRPGMVLLDELDCPAAIVDHRIRATRGSGNVRYLLNDLDKGGWTEASLGARSRIKVAAA